MHNYIKISTLGSLALIGCSESQNKSDEEIQDHQQPNVILIVVDDQGYADMSCTGLAKDVQTPNIDQLAENGVRFTQAYASSPISSPSRGGLITGCYQERWGTFWYGGPGLHDTTIATIPELLKTNGYQTGYIGKVHYGSHDSDTTHRSFPLNHGFDYYFGHTSARKHYMNHVDSLENIFMQIKEEEEKRGQSLRQQALWENFSRVDTIAFSTELFGSKACDYIAANNDKPFFLQVSFNAVHNFTHQLPIEYLHEHDLDGYTDWDPTKEEYYDWYVKGRKPNNPEGREHYLGQLYYLDQQVGRILSCLEENGLDNNTLIIYISDNGGSTPIYANNYPLRGSKYLLYEGGIRVPMIISYPEKFRKGVVSDNMVSGMDILPTICDVTKTDKPKNINGLGLSDLLTGENESLEHNTLIWDTGHEIAVRRGKWKLFICKNDDNARYEMVDVEIGEFLFDLETDPGETTNVKEQYPDIFEELKNAHAEWRKRISQ